MVAWWSGNNAKWDVWARRFNESGKPAGEAFKVKSKLRYENQPDADVGITASGEFLVSWGGATDGIGAGVFAQRFSRSGDSPTHAVTVEAGQSVSHLNFGNRRLKHD